MNVFDDERGPMCSQDEAARISFLAQSGLTLEELRAWEALTKGRAN